jgi:hypothetical protein
MAQTLTRAFPLNHPLMTKCLDRLQAAEPLSEAALTEKAFEKCGNMMGASCLAELRNLIQLTPSFTRIIQGYRQQGCDIIKV